MGTPYENRMIEELRATITRLEAEYSNVANDYAAYTAQSQARFAELTAENKAALELLTVTQADNAELRQQIATLTAERERIALMLHDTGIVNPDAPLADQLQLLLDARDEQASAMRSAAIELMAAREETARLTRRAERAERAFKVANQKRHHAEGRADDLARQRNRWKRGFEDMQKQRNAIEVERDTARDELARVRDLLNQAHAERDNARDNGAGWGSPAEPLTATGAAKDGV